MPVKSIPIKLDRQRRLCFDFNAFAELQRECGLTIVDVQNFVTFFVAFKEKKEKPPLSPLYELRGFLWAGLLDENPYITVKEVGKILDDCMDEKKQEEIGEKLGKALLESTFFKEAKKKASEPELTTVKKKTGARKITSKNTIS